MCIRDSYLGYKKGFSAEDNNWQIIKEARRNDLGLDKIVTKRAITLTVVSKNTRGEHYYTVFQMYEDVVPELWMDLSLLESIIPLLLEQLMVFQKQLLWLIKANNYTSSSVV